MQQRRARDQVCVRVSPERARVVIGSALSREVDYEMSLEAGADDYITKPVKLQSIKQVLKNTFRPYMKVEKWAIRPS